MLSFRMDICINRGEHAMDNKKLLKEYLGLLFSSVFMTGLSAYVYIMYFDSLIMLLGFCCSFSSAMKLTSLTFKAYKNNKSNIL